MTVSIRRRPWPPADETMWQRLCAPASPLDDDGGLAHLRDASREMLREGYAHWLSWVADREPDALIVDPAERASLERLRQWVDTLADVRPMTRLHYVGSALRVLFVAYPARDWSRHRRIVDRLRRAAGQSDASRKAGRILDSGVLFELGKTYALTHPKPQPTPLERVSRFRTGTMIATLALMPMRRKTFATLALGSTVLHKVDRILIAVPEAGMKRGGAWETEVPHPLLPLLLEYIAEVRPWLMRQWGEAHDILWVNDRGRPFEPSYLSNRIAWTTRDLLGVRVSTHLFRDAAATTLARASPEKAQLIAPLLAHSSLDTAERHYIHAGSIEAGRSYAAVVRARKRR